MYHVWHWGESHKIKILALVCRQKYNFNFLAPYHILIMGYSCFMIGHLTNLIHFFFCVSLYIYRSLSFYRPEHLGLTDILSWSTNPSDLIINNPFIFQSFFADSHVCSSVGWRPPDLGWASRLKKQSSESIQGCIDTLSIKRSRFIDALFFPFKIILW